MCLDTVTDNTHDPAAEGWGWKVFEKSGRRLTSWRHISDPYAINEWYEAYDFTPINKINYWRGFHVSTAADGAFHWKNHMGGEVVRKVRWRHRLAIGSQHIYGRFLPCIVAKEILILPERRKSA